MFNPNQYIQPYQYNSYQQQNIVKVNGENGARALQMAPNSSVLMLDESAPIVWLKVTDGAGYATLTAYDITVHEPNENTFSRQIELLTERLNEIEKKINDVMSMPT